jgi:hypothetical protein
MIGEGLRAEGSALAAHSRLERVTGIEPALSAWEAERSGLLYGLTCLPRCLEVTVANRWLPGLMAR